MGQTRGLGYGILALKLIILIDFKLSFKLFLSVLFGVAVADLRAAGVTGRQKFRTFPISGDFTCNLYCSKSFSPISVFDTMISHSSSSLSSKSTSSVISVSPSNGSTSKLNLVLITISSCFLKFGSLTV